MPKGDKCRGFSRYPRTIRTWSHTATSCGPGCEAHEAQSDTIHYIIPEIVYKHSWTSLSWWSYQIQQILVLRTRLVCDISSPKCTVQACVRVRSRPWSHWALVVVTIAIFVARALLGRTPSHELPGRPVLSRLRRVVGGNQAPIRAVGLGGLLRPWARNDNSGAGKIWTRGGDEDLP